MFAIERVILYAAGFAKIVGDNPSSACYRPVWLRASGSEKGLILPTTGYTYVHIYRQAVPETKIIVILL